MNIILLTTYLISVLFSYLMMNTSFDDIDKELEMKHLKNYKKENYYKIILPIIPSLIPIVNLITMLYIDKNKDEIYDIFRSFKCDLLMSDELEKTYNSLTSKKKKELEEDLCRSIDLLKNKDMKEKVLYAIDKKYSDPDIEYFEYNKETKSFEVVDDDYLEEKPKVKKLVI